MKPKAWDDDFDKEFYTDDEIKASDDRAKQITDRLKREKVIKGLECCVMPIDERNCHNCPIGFNDYCALILKRDALELLKAQEREIDFLKQMQLQLIQGMDEQKLGIMVGRVMKWDG